MKLLLGTVTLLIGASLTGGIYWAFLNTPESTIFTLAASVLLFAAAFAVSAITLNLAIEVVTHGFSSAGMRRAIGAIPAALPAGLILLAFWWISTAVEDSVTIRSGQISALFIARLGWADVSWLFNGIHYLAVWMRWVLGAALAVSLMAGVLARGWAAVGQREWIRRALRPRALLIATVAFVTLYAVPWLYLVPWRPRGLPASSAELIFIGAKLAFTAILFAIGGAILVREASRVPAAPQAQP